jgi:host factor-I protein
MKKTIQEIFLKILADNKAPVAVYLRHGIKLKGKIIGFDEKTIFLENTDSSTQLIFIDSVSTVTPIFNL